jgi:translation initiation factor IF-1
MPRTINNKRGARTKSGNTKSVEGKTDIPEHLKKQDCLYINGDVIKQSHGTYIVTCEHELEIIATARKLENKRLEVLEGDRVVCEIPLNSLEAGAQRQRGRIVWRIRKK